MPRLSNQKKKLAVLKQILTENTDVSHPMTMKQIINALGENGIPAERKSIYDDLETLRLLGTDIKTLRGKTTGYYVASREFDLSELKLLADAVRSSKFIPSAQSGELISKLSSLAPVHARPSLKREIFVSNRAETVDFDIFQTVDIIHESMEKDRDITFKYFRWNEKKEKEYRNSGEFYHVSPWSLVWDDSNYYLVGFDKIKKEIRHYRVDKMENVKSEDSPRSGRKQFEKFDINSYSTAVFGMFGGKPERVTLRCSKRLANAMLDRFGRDSVLLKRGDRFDIHVNVVPGPVFLGWVISFGEDAEVISPKRIKEEIEKLKNS